jgi:malate synthase
MRPRGWHLVEKHIRYTDRAGRDLAASGSLVDFGLYFFHNAQRLIDNGVGPYFYLPKIESAEEAKLWDDVFTFSEDYLGIPHGTIRATVLIETLPAAFEMEEILFELRDHIAGLNAGRWDYIFSMIKNYRGRGARFVLPDRSQVTMTVPFMRAYTELLVKTCHKRGAFAIGGMSAFIPNRRDPEVTAQAFEKVAADKKREAGDGFDGTWVAHPDLIPVAQAEFDAVLGERPNQIDRQRPEVNVQASQLIDVHIGLPITAAGVYGNVSVAIRYIEAWLRGSAPSRSTTSWRMPRPPRSAAARCGSGSTRTARRTTAPDHARVHRGPHRAGPGRGAAPGGRPLRRRGGDLPRCRAR